MNQHKNVKDYTLTVFIAFKMAYYCCFSFGEIYIF